MGTVLSYRMNFVPNYKLDKNTSYAGSLGEGLRPKPRNASDSKVLIAAKQSC